MNKMLTRHILAIVDSREMTAGRKRVARDLITCWQDHPDVNYQVVLWPLDIGDVWICESTTPWSIPAKATRLAGSAPAAPAPIVDLFAPAQPESEPPADVPFPPARPRIVVERKALADLQSSFGDGRYRDQKARLINCDADHVVLLVEGYAGSKVRDATAKKRLLSSFVHSMYRDNIGVYHTPTLQDSWDWLHHTCVAMGEGRLVRTAEYMERTKYTDQIQMNRKTNLTPARGLELQLASIPGVSAKMARAVVAEYPTMVALCAAYAALGNDVAAQSALLADLTYRGPSGKDRRLASQSDKIFRYLHGRDEPTPKRQRKK